MSGLEVWGGGVRCGSFLNIYMLGKVFCVTFGTNIVWLNLVTMGFWRITART